MEISEAEQFLSEARMQNLISQNEREKLAFTKFICHEIIFAAGKLIHRQNNQDANSSRSQLIMQH